MISSRLKKAIILLEAEVEANKLLNPGRDHVSEMYNVFEQLGREWYKLMRETVENEKRTEGKSLE